MHVVLDVSGDKELKEKLLSESPAKFDKLGGWLNYNIFENNGKCMVLYSCRFLGALFNIHGKHWLSPRLSGINPDRKLMGLQ